MRNLRFRLHDSLRFRAHRTVYLKDRNSNNRAQLPSNQVWEAFFRGDLVANGGTDRIGRMASAAPANCSDADGRYAIEFIPANRLRTKTL
jgi:hypothetical protein